MLTTLKIPRLLAGLTMIATLVMIGGADASARVPAGEAGPFSPEQLRSLVAGRVQVTERMAGKWRGSVMIRRYSDDGRWTGCMFDHNGKIWDHGKTRGWLVRADHRGRGALWATRSDRPAAIGPFVIHYDPDTGRLLWRRKPAKNSRWIDWNEGWLQDRWPQSAVDKCPDLDLDGVPGDARQTGATLEDLRKQAPDAPLKGLAQPLPGPRMYECEHREKTSSRTCASGTGRIVEYKVYGGRCADWTTKTLWGGGPLVREETDDSACRE